MKKMIALLFCAVSFMTVHAQYLKGYPFTQVPFTAVKISQGSFWGHRIQAAREVTIPLAFSKCKSEGRYDNFVRAAHPSKDYKVSAFMGFPFDDTDVYKTIEGASYVLQTYPDRKLKAYIDSVLDIIAPAQEPDGYLYTARTMNPEHPHSWSGATRWSRVEEGSHELYNLGHLVDAACAHYQATGSKKFLHIAMRYADCVCKEVGSGPGQVNVVPGHQIAEMALARLYVLTGVRKYLDEAKYFLDNRGKTKIRDVYSQSDKPIVQQNEAWGHAVRAGYMYAGMADVAALTGDTAYIHAIDRIWYNIVGKKFYLTGGVGARHQGEAFGADYELPNLTAYNETCAAIAQVYLNLRMFLLHGESKYIDCLERTLYNGLISGMNVDGGRFFYPNPLSSDGNFNFNADHTKTRQPWFGCACCPSNLCRFIPSLPGYLYAVRGTDVYLNLFASNTATISVNGKPVVISMITDYPWKGDLQVKILKNKSGEVNLKLRIPGWLRNQVVPSNLYTYNDGKELGFEIQRDGQILFSGRGSQGEGIIGDDGYVYLRKLKTGDVIHVHFDMEPRTVMANPKVKDDRGRIAVERGPLVYCVESADQPGVDISHCILNARPSFSVHEGYAIKNTEADGKYFRVTEISTPVQEAFVGKDGKVALKDVSLRLIPYYAWGHRGAGLMDVWMQQGLGN